MNETTILTEGEECFYCAGELGVGDKVFEQGGKFCHPECYYDEIADPKDEMEETPDDDDENDDRADEGGPDGGDDD
jgi:hypothetical protein